MVKVGEMEIRATMSTEDLDRGADRVRNKMDDIRSQSDSTSSSFSTLAGMAGSLASSLISIGSVGVAAMTGLASMSPQVAPAMAKIKNETRELSFALGEKLNPLFKAIGNDLIPAIGTAIENWSPQIQNMVDIGVEGISDISSALTGEWEEIDNLVPKGAGAAIGIALGAPFGLGGMMLGAVLGSVAGDKLAESSTAGMTKEEIQNAGVYAETKGSYNQLINEDWDLPPSERMSFSHQFGRWIDVGKLGFNAIVDSIQYLIQNGNDKDLSYSGNESL